MMFFGVRISTYKRPTGTLHILARCLQSILRQDFKDWKIFLIGDHYDSQEEFDKLASMIPPEKIYYENLPVSLERGKYSGGDLWRCAGRYACCYGLQKLREQARICACLDDDDWWLPDHLSTLWEAYKKYPDAAFVYTKSTYKSDNSFLPNENVDIHYDNLMPRAYNLIHSAASWDAQKIPLEYRNVIEVNSPWVAGDADLWERMREYCQTNGLRTIYVPKLTVRHDQEGQRCMVEPILL